ncbi:MAG: nickel pincer cofactor biosynthesis protein LarB [Candidatus Wallbacteria bacterium]|nr:nickel pincer cofactor biosynthesis protein LarB [Candidatus Wallbacteria bacterium]
MNVRVLLEAVQEGRMTIAEAEKSLRDLAFEATPFAHIDHHRLLRRGFPEVVYCEGKTTQQSAEIFSRLALKNPNVLATRAEPEVFEAVKEQLPEATYDELARCIHLHRDQAVSGYGTILVVTAGTADLPVAREAYVTAEIMGNKTVLISDVGVSGIHRLLAYKETLQSAAVIIVVAGMEGALPSVVGGLVDCPVIAVPTSVGYGASFGGVAALLAMLNGCSSGMTVVNIDNGFGAAYAASLMNRKRP